MNAAPALPAREVIERHVEPIRMCFEIGGDAPPPLGSVFALEMRSVSVIEAGRIRPMVRGTDFKPAWTAAS